MQQLYKFISNYYVLAFLFLGVIIINVWMYFGIGGISDIKYLSGGANLPDTNLYQNIDNLGEMMLDYGSQGRLYYLKYQFRDFIYPFFYGALLMGILYRLIKPKSFNIWIFIPWVAVAFDFIENYYLRICFYDFPKLVDYKVNIASYATSLKWFFVFLSFVLIVIAYIHRRRKYLAAKSGDVRASNIYVK